MSRPILPEPNPYPRRAFLKDLALASGSLLLSARLPALQAQIAPGWKDHIGLELFTVRDLLRQDYEGTLAKLAAMGYKEVEPADPYDRLQPKEYKALLDKYGFKMFSTHAGATAGPDLERQLEGFQLMGIRYTEVHAPRGPGGPRRARGPGGPPGPGGGPPPPRPPQTVESVKRACAQMNNYGAIVKRFGMKILIHNHTGEFERLDDGKTTQYDVFLAETDPELVAMQLDIGWAYVAGQDALAMFKKNPGRFELWHVKDAKFKNLDPGLTPNQRMRAAKIVVLGQGDIDYRAVFADAAVAGMKHFVIEQDTAGHDGRYALEDCRIAYDHLHKLLA